jgi:predicted nuclease of predicted toxin-antitoxin system
VRFLIDAQLPTQLAKHLSAKGYPATHIFEHLDPQAEDVEIARLANLLGCSVISKDADFVTLVERGLLDHTLVQVRLPNLKKTELLLRVDLAWADVVSAVRRQAGIVEIR